MRDLLQLTVGQKWRQPFDHVGLALIKNYSAVPSDVSFG